jgi:hypothetical protein
MAVWGVSLPAGAAQTISGFVYDYSTWRESLPAPPGDGNGIGTLVVAVYPAGANGTYVAAVDKTNLASGALPFAVGPYAFTLATNLADGAYAVRAWIDGNQNGSYDVGEPLAHVETAIASNSVSDLLVKVYDDGDDDGLPDWWEYHYFLSLEQTGDGDADGDGLTNKKEADLANAVPALATLAPNDWDSDNDGMDDKWEYDHFLGTGDPNPCHASKVNDADGDGLSDWQEYCGVDGIPRMTTASSGSVRVGALTGSSDDLNPLDVDTDLDMLLDSFEAAWYDPVNGIDPRAGTSSGSNTVGGVNTSIAQADSDHDGLSNYREQCLLTNLWQASTNGSMWDWADRVPFPFVYIHTDGGPDIRMCTMNGIGAPLALGLKMDEAFCTKTNRDQLRNHAWTDPTEGTGYAYVNEDIPPGHDTDADWLPDGWEVQFNLDPRDDGLGATWDNGPFGDPDGDGLVNLDEFFGQDGNRSTTLPYINGTGDETNPNEYNWRPDSTYEWRWRPANVLVSLLSNPRTGTGISRKETLGSALPTTSLGIDLGADTDDDGIPDADEISPTNGAAVSSPVFSCDPFIPRAALIVNTNGIAIPDPEPAAQNGQTPAGTREDLLRRDWTIECQVKLLGTNLTGNLFDFETIAGPRAVVVYRLSLSNNIPMLTAHNERLQLQTVTAHALPTNRWIHLAGVWDHANNSMGLYVNGILFNAAVNVGESFSSRFMFPATNRLALAVSPDGSFTNRLMLDEVRIWGVARTGDQIAGFAGKLVPLGNGDDVWVDKESPQYYGRADMVLVNGGSLFEGEPGVALSNVCQAAETANFWIDDGDLQFNAANDIVLMRDAQLVEGLPGALVSNVRWNDKDGDGVFSRDSLLAYYRFDDGGSTVEDFARHAKNGLLGATFEDLPYGDRGYALPTNNLLWVTNGAAPILGVDLRGADDSDHDGMPDAWEMTHRLDPWDDGTHGESSPGAKDGPNGANGDPDGDGLINIYEYWAGTNPHASASDGDGVLDTLKDRDGDGVVNIVEQRLGSRPDRVDTDDDGSTDSEEQGAGTSPIDPTDRPTDYYPKSLAVVFGGSPSDYLGIPTSFKQRLTDMTLEAWVMPADATNGAGIIVRRAIENLPGGGYAVNYVMGLATNAGGLQLYAGYVTPDGSPAGRPYIVRGGPIAAGQWTHVAMSYSALNATLTLYTNGTSCAVTNAFYEAPRVNGLGGETFVRMGEDLAGSLDEVRVWNKVRTVTEIRSAMTNILLSGAATDGLVHFYRFDDAEANTNRSGWSEFHRPGGLQDFTYSADWSTQWAHAAAKHGIVGFTNGAIRAPPSLRVIIAPDAAKSSGAQWQLDGGGWQNGGDSIQGAAPGVHTVAYKAISGWTEPAMAFVILSNDVATTLTGTYIQKASISVSFSPQEALDAGMQWRVDNSGWQWSGAVVQNLDAGYHTLSYTPLTGYIDPIVKSVDLASGEARVVPAQYSRMYGTLSAILQPAEAAAKGVQWRISGRDWTNSGAVLSLLPLGTYTVDFNGVPGWVAPPSVSVDLSNQVPVTVTGQFAIITGLETVILPPEVVTNGALWRLSGGDWTNSGTFLRLSSGAYTVQFKPVDGWLTPGDVSATVVSQQMTSVSATYLRADILGGSVGSEVGQFNQPRAVALDATHRVYVADTFNDRIQMYDPRDRSWTVWGGWGTNVAQFDKPSGVAVDAGGNVYVADANNNRVQKRAAATGQWQAWGGYGTNAGQFILPSDVAVDARTNLYVADLFNNRVQRRDAAGVWAVAISNGLSSGRVTAPKGLLTDGADNLYVSDDGTQTNGQSRIQKFNAAGQFVAVLGGRLPSEGSLKRPGGLALGDNNLYVADIENSRVAWSAMTNTVWTTLLGSNVLSRPEDVAWDPRGFLYVADTMHHRVLSIPVTGNLTNGVATLTGLVSAGTNDSFTLYWYARSNWYYAVEHAGSLMSTSGWMTLAGATNIPGRDAVTNYTDRTLSGVTNRFYRIIAY